MRKFPLAISKMLVVVLGLLWMGTGVSLAQVTVSLPTGQIVSTGSDLDIPITVGDVTGQDVVSYSFTLTYDPAVLSISGASVTGTLSEGAAPVVNTETAGEITVAFAQADALTGAGTLINLNATTVGGGISSLSFNGSFVFNEGVPAVVEVDGDIESVDDGIFLPANGSGSGDVMIPITATDLSGFGILSYSFTVKYDPAVVTVTGVMLDGTLSEGGSAEVNTSTAGQITIAYARADAISGSGTLLYLLGTTGDVGTTTLEFCDVLFNEDPTIGIATVNGMFTTLANGAPAFDALPVDASISEGDTYEFTFSATDPEGEDVTLTLVDGAGVANAMFVDGVLTFTPDDTQGDATYTFTVDASDPNGNTSSATVMVTVINVIETFVTNLNGVNEVPVILSSGSGAVTVELDGTMLTVGGAFDALSGDFSAAHIHVAPVGENGGVALVLTATVDADNRGGSFDSALNTFDLTTDLAAGFDVDGFKASLRDGDAYVNVHTSAYGGGELRGQLLPLGNQHPEASDVTGPTDGSSVTITGNPDDDLFTISFGEASDPDGDMVTYIYQLSADAGFGDVYVMEASALPFEVDVTVEEAAELFDDVTERDPGDIDVGGEATVYHRVITSDGSLWTVGPTASVTLVRGTVTSNEVSEMPDFFALKGNYPNPFNPVTSIQIDLPASAEVSVVVMDLLGRQVMAVPAQRMSAGANQTLQLQAGNLASGVYVYRVVAKTAETTFVKAATMTLLK